MMELQFEIEKLEELKKKAERKLDDLEDEKAELEGEIEDVTSKLIRIYEELNKQWEEEHQEMVSEYYRGLL